MLLSILFYLVPALVIFALVVAIVSEKYRKKALYSLVAIGISITIAVVVIIIIGLGQCFHSGISGNY